MALTPLVGNEILYVVGTSGNGNLAPRTFETTTARVAGAPIPPAAVGASATAVPGSLNLMSAASGSVLTLPAATGSGNLVNVIVSTTVTSNAHKVLAASSSDFLQGVIDTEDGGTMTGWYAALSSSFCSLQLNGSTTGGFQGEWYEFRDIATHTWQVRGVSKSSGTAATPFSTADS